MRPHRRLTVHEIGGRWRVLDKDHSELEVWDQPNDCLRPVEFKSRSLAHAYIAKQKNIAEQRPHWKALWKAAFHNCPYKIRVSWASQLESVGEMPIPKFIKLQAKGRIKYLNEKPCIMKRFKLDETPSGQRHVLALLLGYTTKRKDGSVRSNQSRIYQNTVQGIKPRKREQQELLTAFAGVNGTLVMRRMLKERGLDQKYCYPSPIQKLMTKARENLTGGEHDTIGNT